MMRKLLYRLPEPPVRSTQFGTWLERCHEASCWSDLKTTEWSLIRLEFSGLESELLMCCEFPFSYFFTSCTKTRQAVYV